MKKGSCLVPNGRPFLFFTKVNALCVHWKFLEETCSNPSSARSYDIPFEKERYFFRLVLHTLPQASELVLFAADGSPRRPKRPFHVSVFVWGNRSQEHPWQRLDRTCSLLAQGTVVELPWAPDYDHDFLNRQIKTEGDSFSIYHSVDFLFVFESSSVTHDISQCSACHRPNIEGSGDDSSEGGLCFPEKSADGEKNRGRDNQQNASGTSKDWDFPSNLERLSLDFANLLKNETLPDVKLKCGGGEIPAHRSVLAARSEVFAAMFRNDTAESRSGDVDVPDVDDDVIDPFLQYVYSGKIPSGVPDEVVPGLYAAADKYAVLALKETCRQRMVSRLTEDNCVHFLTLSDAHGDAEFKKSVIDYICNHEAVLKGDTWREFAKKQSPLAIEVYDSFVERKT